MENQLQIQPRQPSPLLYPRGVAQVEFARKRLGITPQELERKRHESINKPF
jgi:hypothetical protein